MQLALNQNGNFDKKKCGATNIFLVYMTTFVIPVFSPQIKEKLLQLTDKRKEMIDKWENRWEWLRLGEKPL